MYLLICATCLQVINHLPGRDGRFEIGDEIKSDRCLTLARVMRKSLHLDALCSKRKQPAASLSFQRAVLCL